MWIPTLAGARWHACPRSVTVDRRLVIGAGREAPWLFPQLVTAGWDHHGFGRPPRKIKDHELVMYVAWARDIAGLTQNAVAQSLYDNDDDKERTRVQRAERDGRQLYAAAGVLPWATYADEPHGAPVANWWADAAFAASIKEWLLQAVTNPTDEPQPDPVAGQHAALERTRERAVRTVAASARRFRKAGLIRIPVIRPRVRIDPDRLRDRILRDHGVEPWEFPGEAK